MRRIYAPSFPFRMLDIFYPTLMGSGDFIVIVFCLFLLLAYYKVAATFTYTRYYKCDIMVLLTTLIILLQIARLCTDRKIQIIVHAQRLFYISPGFYKTIWLNTKKVLVDVYVVH